MDLHTQHGSTVAPLPESGRGGKERERLHQTYNTRYLSGRS
jgi:hypothetical protein